MSYEYDDMIANSDRGYEMQLDRIMQESQKDTTIEDTEAFFEYQNKNECNLSTNHCIDELHKSLEKGWDKLINKKPISKVMQRNYDYLGIRYAKQE